MIDIEKFYQEDVERDIKILLSHLRHHEWLGQDHDDILNSVFVGSIIKGRMFLDFLGIKADKETKKLSFKNPKKNSDDIDAVSVGARLAEESDLSEKERIMLFDFLSAVNKAEAHRTIYSQNNDDIIHPSIKVIMRLVNDCLFEKRKLTNNYAQHFIGSRF